MKKYTKKSLIDGKRILKWSIGIIIVSAIALMAVAERIVEINFVKWLWALEINIICKMWILFAYFGATGVCLWVFVLGKKSSVETTSTDDEKLVTLEGGKKENSKLKVWEVIVYIIIVLMFFTSVVCNVCYWWHACLTLVC